MTRSLGIKANKPRLPSPGTIIASSHTSPIDCLYLAAIFDPIFTISYPNTRDVLRVSLRQAIVYSLSTPKDTPPPGSRLTTLAELTRDNPQAIVLVFPECTTTNGRGILNFSPSLLAAGPKTKIYPVNVRYSPADITTPVPGTWLTFLWNLCSKPTNCIRVRIAASTNNASGSITQGTAYDTNYFDTLHAGEMRERSVMTNGIASSSEDEIEEVDEEGRKVLDHIGEALARLGRVKRVNLGVADKQRFTVTWSKHRRIW